MKGIPTRRSLFIGALMAVAVFGAFIPASQAWAEEPTAEDIGIASATSGNGAPIIGGGKGAGTPADKIATASTLGWLSTFVKWVTVDLATMFLYMAAVFLGAAVKLSLSGSIYALSFVASGWTLARDIANMMFLFVLVYIAFSVMLNVDTGNTLSTLAWVVFMALIVNFSFFGTRLVVDMGNVVSIQFYNAIRYTPDANTPTLLAQLQAKDLSQSIMNTLSPQTMLGTPQFTAWQNDVRKNGAGGIEEFVTLSTIFIIVGLIAAALGVAFFYAGSHFITRIAYLWLAIAVAPLALVATAIPIGSVKKYFDKWISMLFKHAFYPAGFLFVFLLLTVFLDSMSASGLMTGGTSASQAAAVGNAYVAAAGAAPSGGLYANLFERMRQAQGASNNLGFLYGLGSTATVIFVFLGLVLVMVGAAASAGKMLGGFATTAVRAAGKFVNKQVGSRALRVGRIGVGAVTGGAKTAGLAVGRETVGRATAGLTKKIGSAMQETRLAAKPGLIGRATYRAGGAVKGADLLGAGAFRKVEKGRGEVDRERTEKAQDRALLQTAITNPQTLSPENRKRLEKISADTVVDTLKPSETKQIASMFSDSKIEAIEKSAKYTREDKEAIRKAWHEGAADAPHQQANKLLKEVRDAVASVGSGITGVDDTLKKLAIGSKVDATTLRQMSANMTMALSALRTDQKQAQADFKQAQADFAAGRIDAAAFQRVLEHSRDVTAQVLDTNKAIQALKTVEKDRMKIPPGTTKTGIQHDKGEVIVTE